MTITRETARYLLASHIQSVSDVPSRKQRHRRREYWLTGFIALLALVFLIGAV